MKNRSKETYLRSIGRPELNMSSKSLGELVKTFMQKEKGIKFKAKGHSMKPIIKENDLITISSYKQEIPCTGDIVAYLHFSTKELIIHRLIKITGNEFISRGDNCRHSDKIHETKFILGYVSQINGKNSIYNILILPPAKRILVFLSNTRLLYIFNRFLGKNIET